MTSLAPPPDPPAPGGSAAWPPWSGVLAVAAAVVLSLMGGLAVAVFAALGGVAVFEEGAPTPPGVLVAAAFVQGVVFVGVAIGFGRLSGPAYARDFGLRTTPVWRAVGITVGLYVAFVLATAVWWSLVGNPGDERLLRSLGIDRNAVLLVLGALTVCVVAPLGEEFLFRGFLFPSLRNGLGVGWAAVATGVIFGLLHGLSSEPENLLPLAALGAALCLIYQATGSLYPCIALHAINNAIALATNEDWDWEVVPPLALAAVAACLGASAAAARLWRP